MSLDSKVSLEEPSLNWWVLLLGSIVLIGVFGNVLVCLAICLERRLQNATNYFLLSLAVADLFVSILVMPMSILELLYGFWPFNYSLCNAWITSDVLFSSASIYHMVFISIGRFIGIRNPLRARQARLIVSRRGAIYKILLAWLLSALISSPITILAIIDPKNIQPNSKVCLIDNQYFQIFGSLVAFFLPMIVMINTYILTVRLLRKRAKFCSDSPYPLHLRFTAKTKGKMVCNSSNSEHVMPSKARRENMSSVGGTVVSFEETSSPQASCIQGSPSSLELDDRLRGKSSSDRRRNQIRRSLLRDERKALQVKRSASCSQGMADYYDETNVDETRRSREEIFLDNNDVNKGIVTAVSQKQSKYPINGINEAADKTEKKQEPLLMRAHSSYQVRTEQKATHVLGLVFFAFIVCWSPFFTLNILTGFMRNLQVSDTLGNTFLWLGYLSSTLNPIIYTIFNKNFRTAFRRIILQVLSLNFHTHTSDSW